MSSGPFCSEVLPMTVDFEQRLRDSVEQRARTEQAENVVSFGNVAAGYSDHSQAGPALELVHQVTGTIAAIREEASETEARAQALAVKAIEKLQLAERRIHSAEFARREAAVEAAMKLGEAMKALKKAETRAMAAEA